MIILLISFLLSLFLILFLQGQLEDVSKNSNSLKIQVWDLQAENKKLKGGYVKDECVHQTLDLRVDQYRQCTECGRTFEK